MPWIVAFVEGFSTLAVEVVALRLALPVVGSSATLTGVMLGVVLLALSAGYWRGGALSARWDRPRMARRLGLNLALAAALYAFVAFPLEPAALSWLLSVGGPLPLAVGGAALLLFFPVYLASQSVPLLAEMTNRDGKAGAASGKVLFYSTLGSVVGGVATPVFLFPTLGVLRSALLTCGLLALAAALAAFRDARRTSLVALALAITLGGAALAPADPSLPFSFDSAYQNFRVAFFDKDGRQEKVLLLNGGHASGIWADTGESSFGYVRGAVETLSGTKAQDVLVIGSAGFTFPRDAAAMPWVKTVDAVDVDPAVKLIAEKEFLGVPLDKKIRFVPQSARYAVRHTDEKNYGFTLLDAYQGQGVPDELVTREFFRDVAAVSQKTVANAILDRALASDFSRNLLATFRDGFGGVWTRDANPSGGRLTNVLVASWPAPGFKIWTGAGTVWTDDRNSADNDRTAMWR